MARTKQTARKSEGPANAQKPMNSYSMRIAPYIQKSMPLKTRKPKVKKDKKVKVNKEVSPPSSPWESEEEDSGEE